MLAAQGQAEYIGRWPGQQVAGRLGLLAVDQPRQLADAAAFAKAPGKTQHHHLLGQWIALRVAGLQATVGQRLTANLLQPCLGSG